MKLKIITGWLLLYAITAGITWAKDLPALNVAFKSALALTSHNTLTVTTGRTARTWELTGQGLATVGVRHVSSDKDWTEEGFQHTCDWELPGIAEQGRLISLKAHPANDQGFTSAHLEVVATFEYARNNLSIQYVIWAYPGSSGLRTQLRCKLMTGSTSPTPARTSGPPAQPNQEEKERSQSEEGIVDSLPVSMINRTLHSIGYYAGTQNRNTHELEILKEQKQFNPPAEGQVEWASILAVREADRGIMLVKESHKCVNTPNMGANTGRFTWDARGIRNTGTGWYREDFTQDRYRKCWATWMVLYQGDENEMALTLKTFDRQRYPIDPTRDIYILANTWGSSKDMRSSRMQAREDNIMTEIDSQADLGIDVQQIDDGWQGFDFDSWRPIPSYELRPDDAIYPIYQSDTYPVYPNGWGKVREYARGKGIKLGLWAAINISAGDLIWNYEQGDFRYYKLDYAHLGRMKDVDKLMGKARKLILHSRHKTRINWDLTEKNPRVGYFFGREYGNIYLENRKPEWPPGVVYKPYLVQRDAWQLSKYVNLNKFQITIQNVDLVSRELSDAYQHPHDYCLAQTLMSSPIFFQETHYYTEAARENLRPLIKLYKEHRNRMFQGYVFPIGDKPDNRSWSGFQNHDPESHQGYVILLRQLHNSSTKRRISLKFLRGKKIALTDLQTREHRTVDVPESGEVEFQIAPAPGYLFLKYVVL